ESTGSSDPTLGEAGEASSSSAGDEDSERPGTCQPSLGEGSCPAACDSCESGVCQIDCIGDNSCSGGGNSIVCPPGWPCEITGTGTGSCVNMSISCNADNPCDSTCSSGACGGSLTFNCGGGPDSLTCHGSPGINTQGCELACDADLGSC